MKKNLINFISNTGLETTTKSEDTENINDIGLASTTKKEINSEEKQK